MVVREPSKPFEMHPELRKHSDRAAGIYAEMGGSGPERQHYYYSKKLADKLLGLYGNYNDLDLRHKNAVIAAYYYRVPRETWRALDLSKGVKDLLGQMHSLKELEVAEIGKADGNFFKRLSERVGHGNAFNRRTLVMRAVAVLHSFEYVRSLRQKNQIFLAKAALHYARLMEAMDLGEIKRQLEDNAFSILNPNAHSEFHAIRQRVERDQGRSRTLARDAVGILNNFWVDRFGRNVRVKYPQEPADKEYDVEVKHRIKEPWSAYVKSFKPEYRRVPRHELPDWHGVRLVFQDRRTCVDFIRYLKSYEGVGSYAIKNDTVDDYITRVKPTGYQSWHGIIYVGKRGFELQLRDKHMDKKAETGSAASYVYKISSDANLPDLHEEDRAVFDYLAEGREELKSMTSGVAPPKISVAEQYFDENGERQATTYDFAPGTTAAELLAYSRFKERLQENPSLPFRILINKQLQSPSRILHDGDVIFFDHPRPKEPGRKPKPFKGFKLGVQHIRPIETEAPGAAQILRELLLSKRK
jgi:ppGpp synthetase/RelA/SpoT-type nucleotidyltranferase